MTGANGTNWSGIEHALDINDTYVIKFDLLIKNASSNQVFGLGIKDDSGYWKIMNNWETYLQLRENPNFSERNVLMTWDHTNTTHSFEIIISPTLYSYIIVKEDNKILKSWQSNLGFEVSKFWISQLGQGDYYISNFSLSTYEEPTPTPTSTPTPTETPTPTDTPTPIPTPTPTLIPTSKVIVIPGMGATLSTKLLTCDLSPGGTWFYTPTYGDIYKSLIDTLSKNGYSPISYLYDWRLQIPGHAIGLATYINSNSETNERVDIVGHSMGGLVARAYLDYQGGLQKVDKLMTIGTPHRGTPIAYPALTGGELWIDDSAAKFGYAFIKNWCSKLTGLSESATIQRFIPSFYDLLPIDPYLRSKQTDVPYVGTLQNPWLLSSQFPSSLFGTSFRTLSGVNFKTLSEVVVGDPKKDSWVDGKPTQKIWSDAGDGTILNSSSMIEGADNDSIHQDHTNLIGSAEGQQKILEFLGTSPLANTPGIGTNPETSVAIITYPAWVWITDPNGNILKDTDGFVIIGNPKSGAYKYILIPKTTGETRIAVAQFLKNGDIKWKDYYHHGILPKIGTITFDPENASEDILQ